MSPWTVRMLGLGAGGTLVFAGLAWGLQSAEEAIRAVVAGAICTVLTSANLEIADRTKDFGTNWQMGVALLGGMVRIFFALGLGGLAYCRIEACGSASFLIWLLVGYLATLALEMTLLVRLLGMCPAKGAAPSR